MASSSLAQNGEDPCYNIAATFCFFPLHPPKTRTYAHLGTLHEKDHERLYLGIAGWFARSEKIQFAAALIGSLAHWLRNKFSAVGGFDCLGKVASHAKLFQNTNHIFSFQAQPNINGQAFTSVVINNTQGPQSAAIKSIDLPRNPNSRCRCSLMATSWGASSRLPTDFFNGRANIRPLRRKSYLFFCIFRPLHSTISSSTMKIVAEN